MTLWMRLLLWATCCLVGWLLSRRWGRGRVGLWWAFWLGPVGLVLFLIGEMRRRKAGRPAALTSAAAWPPAEELNVPVQVQVGGTWRDGSLKAWRQGSEVWEGWVVYSDDDSPGSAWFTADHVRRVDAPA